MIRLQEILLGLVDDFKDGKFGVYNEHTQNKQCIRKAEEVLGQCILSSGWNYSKARTASNTFLHEYSDKYRASGSLPLNEIKDFLCSSAVRHRFPNKKAEQLKASFEKLWTINNKGNIDFSDYDNEIQRREYLVLNFAGLGFKQASMFLRDLGLANELAIIDAHVVWFFKNVQQQTIIFNSRKNYLKSEKTISFFCETFDIPVGILDLLIWNLVRSYKSEVEKQKCQMQYVLPLEDWTPQHAYIY